MEMTKEQFIETMKDEKERYINSLSAYFDALIEHDFDKAVELADEIVMIINPETQAYIARQMMANVEHGKMQRCCKHYEKQLDLMLDEL